MQIKYNNNYIKVLKSIRAKTILMPCNQDLYFRTKDNEYEGILEKKEDKYILKRVDGSQDIINVKDVSWKKYSGEKYSKDNYVVTTVGQLNFFRWAIKNNIIDYVQKNLITIENDMNVCYKAVYNIDKCNHVKNRLSCYGKYGVCEYYKTEHCS